MTPRKPAPPRRCEFCGHLFTPVNANNTRSCRKYKCELAMKRESRMRRRAERAKNPPPVSTAHWDLTNPGDLLCLAGWGHLERHLIPADVRADAERLKMPRPYQKLKENAR